MPTAQAEQYTKKMTAKLKNLFSLILMKTAYQMLKKKKRKKGLKPAFPFCFIQGAAFSPFTDTLTRKGWCCLFFL